MKTVNDRTVYLYELLLLLLLLLFILLSFLLSSFLFVCGASLVISQKEKTALEGTKEGMEKKKEKKRGGENHFFLGEKQKEKVGRGLHD